MRGSCPLKHNNTKWNKHLLPFEQLICLGFNYAWCAADATIFTASTTPLSGTLFHIVPCWSVSESAGLIGISEVTLSSKRSPSLTLRLTPQNQVLLPSAHQSSSISTLRSYWLYLWNISRTRAFSPPSLCLLGPGPHLCSWILAEAS